MSSIKLTKPSDWDQWIASIASQAQDLHVWSLVKPDSTEAERARQHKTPTKPTKPTAADETAASQYKMDIMEYNINLHEYERQQNALRDLKRVILNTITKEPAVHIEDQDLLSSYDILSKLSALYSLPREARQAKLRQQWDELLLGKQRGQSLDQWLDQWAKVYSRAKHLDMYEATEPRATDSFSRAMRPYAPAFAEANALKLGTETTTLLVTIQQFRAYAQKSGLSLESSGTTGNSHNAQFRGKSASGTSAGTSTSPGTGTYTPPPTPKCKVEPDTNHFFAQCPYLNELVRPKGWKGDPDLIRKAEKLLKGPEGDMIRQRINKRNETVKSHNDNGVKVSYPVFRTGASHFNSWILDTGSTDHVCNESMRDRFVKTRDSTPDDTIEAGGQDLLIEAFGTIEITAQSACGGTVTIELNDVAFIPSMGSNLMSVAVMERKGALWDMAKGVVNHNGKPLFKVEKLANLYLVENNSSSNGGRAAYRTTRSTTSANWHRILGHPSPETLRHLKNATEGAEIVENDIPAPRTNECESCAVSKIRQIISRSPEHEFESTAPFQRITYDLMDNGISYNKQRWITHLHDTFTNYSLVYAHPFKNDTINVIESVVQLVKQRFNLRINFFRSDQEPSLGEEFATLCRNHAITWEPSVPHTQAQNGHAERHANLLTTKGMALRHQSNLPHELWPEIYVAAGYLLNRTPRRNLQWKTPFEMLFGKKPDISHLRAYGCKAYSKKNTLTTASMRLDDRAHIGYLIGYSSRNIFRIWVPGHRRIYRSRDVLFDESSFYSPNDVVDPIATATPEQVSIELSEPVELELPNADPFMRPDLGLIWEPYVPPATITPENHTQIFENNLPSTTSSAATMPTPPLSQRVTSTAPESIFCPEQDENAIDNIPETPTSLPITHAQDEYSEMENTSLLSDLDSSLFEDATEERPASEVDDDDIEQLTSQLQPLATRDINSSISASNILPSGSRRRAMAATSTQRWHRDDLPPEPSNLRHLRNHRFKTEFDAAFDREIQALVDMGAYKPVPKSHAEGAQILPLTVVFKYKFDNEGFLLPGNDGFKTRVCVRGDKQLGTTIDTYAATIAVSIIRFILGIEAIFNLSSIQFDMKAAYLHARIKGTILCWPLAKMAPDGMILQLLRALYGLRESPALWQSTLTEALVSFGLTPVPGVPCLLTNDHLIVFYYVDDVVVLFAEDDRPHADEFARKLAARFNTKNLGELRWFLALNIVRNRETREIWLSQESYINKITTKFLKPNTKRATTPLPLDCPIVPNNNQATKADIKLFQQKMGSLQFAATVSRPDISCAVSILSEHSRNPSETHHCLANHVFSYLAATSRLSVHFSAANFDDGTVFTPWADASFANDEITRKSRTGAVLKLFGGPIMWKSTKQKTVTTSSTEAELTALSLLAKETLWWERVFKSVHFNPGHQIHLHCDNRQTIRLVCEDSQRLDTKLRHVDVHNHWLRQEVKEHRIKPLWTPTAKMVADGLTKTLPKGKHAEFVSALGLSEVPAALQHRT